VTSVLILAIILFAAGAVASMLLKAPGGLREKSKYSYKRQSFFMSRAEHECYKALIEAAGGHFKENKEMFRWGDAGPRPEM
jgi:hypothetical protein